MLQGGKEKSTEQGPPKQLIGSKDQVVSYGEGNLSLDFKEADIGLVIQKIAESAHQNLIVSDAVQEKISLGLIDVPWQEALEIILRNRNLAIIREGNMVRIVNQGEYNQKKE